jgi:xanthine dehydrogenase accessory factor
VTTAGLLARADGLRAQRVPYVLATVVRAERPTSAVPGDRAIVLGDGTVDGFVGGACAAATLRAQSLEVLRAGRSRLLRITPATAGAEPVEPAPGLVVVDNPCLSGGTLEIFLEAVVPPPLVQVFGDAPIARALVDVGAAAGYDLRATTDPAAPVPPDAAAVVVASHGHDEEPVLRAALAAGVPYVALVASPKRGAAVLAGLAGPAEPAEPAIDAGRVKSPAGLDIGARTPGEVAVSILAELVSARAAPAAGGAGLEVPAAVSGAAAAPTAVDPVCGMTVAAVPASLSAEHAGRTWYFCAPGCRAAFLAEPGRYGG